MIALCPALDGLRLGVKFALHRSGIIIIQGIILSCFGNGTGTISWHYDSL